MRIRPDILKEIAKIKDRKEQGYSKHATKDSQYLRRYKTKHEDPIIRPPFFRDADRIMHSKAYARYVDKTQVFFLVENDHITHRVLHVQLVSKIARAIGRALKLNEDLIEAISLGHDIGHVPYGHLGETFLSDLCIKNKIGPFKHNIQSVQFLDTIENCDLTIQVLDGILCHNGEVNNKSLKPSGTKTWHSFDAKIKKIKNDDDGNVFPLTYEGCVVRFADNIAYLGRDLQDAFEVNLLKDIKNSFPQNCREFFKVKSIKKINWTILDSLTKDVINNSFEQDVISFSDDASQCVKELKDFNYDVIYKNKKLLEQKPKIEKMFEMMFNTFLNDLIDEKTESIIYQDMIKLKWISHTYLRDAKLAEIVRDYIAGMTDRYFNTVFNQIAVPIKYSGRYP